MIFRKEQKIAIFDSGIGGLNVLKELVKQFPYESFIYLADTLNCPYGTKQAQEITEIVIKNIKYFEKQDVKAIIIACNTATANSYQIASVIPIIRIIEPTAQIALRENMKVAVLATNYTIKSLAYERFLGTDMIGICASELVDLAEAGKQNTRKAKKTIKRLIKPIIGKVDAIILGCTHFTFFEKTIKKMAKGIKIIDSCQSIGMVLEQFLLENSLKNDCGKAEIVIQCTGNPLDLQIQSFNYQKEEIKKVIID